MAGGDTVVMLKRERAGERSIGVLNPFLAVDRNGKQRFDVVWYVHFVISSETAVGLFVLLRMEVEGVRVQCEYGFRGRWECGRVVHWSGQLHGQLEGDMSTLLSWGTVTCAARLEHLRSVTKSYD